MIRASIQILGPAVTLAGVLLSIWGTFLLTRWYHPFDFRNFVKAAVHVTLLYIRGRSKEANEYIEAATKIGHLNEERRARSMAGLLVIFAGFLLQAIGAVCWGADMAWGILEKKPPGCG